MVRIYPQMSFSFYGCCTLKVIINFGIIEKLTLCCVLQNNPNKEMGMRGRGNNYEQKKLLNCSGPVCLGVGRIYYSHVIYSVIET